MEPPLLEPPRMVFGAGAPIPLDELPEEIEFGFVSDRVVLAVGDTTKDPDRFPDFVPAEGKVTFTPLTPFIIVMNPPTTVSKQPIVCTYTDGWLTDTAGHVGDVALIAGMYQVTYNMPKVKSATFRIQVGPENTVDSPVWLALQREIPPSPTTKFVVNEQVYLDALAARDGAVAARDELQVWSEQSMLWVRHEANADAPRPDYGGPVYWLGTVAPVNAVYGDWWAGA